MKQAIQLLKLEREKVLLELKKGETRQLSYKLELDQAIQWLTTITDLEWEAPKNYQIQKLPPTKMAFAEFKIVDDYESDAPQDWRPVIQNGEALYLLDDDFILQKK